MVELSAMQLREGVISVDWIDDDEGLVTIEEDGTGDLVTGYQDDMFLED